MQQADMRSKSFMSAFMGSKFGKRGGKEKIGEEVVKDEGDLIFIYTVFYCPY